MRMKDMCSRGNKRHSTEEEMSGKIHHWKKVWKRRVQQVLIGLLLFFGSVSLTGCDILSQQQVKLRDLEFTVLSSELVPEKLMDLLQERKNAPFQITYTDADYLYLCIGYGEQKTGGYSIVVDELYLTEHDIHVASTLLGPGAEEKKNTQPSYPMIVIKLEKLDQPVVFD